MKNIRIELEVRARVVIGEGVTEEGGGGLASTDSIEMTQLFPLVQSALYPEPANIEATVKGQMVGMLAKVAHVLPERMGHAAKKLA